MDPTAKAWMRLHFENAWLRRRGTEFQNFFSDLMERRYGQQFQRVKPYGRRGDLKCDGYLRNGSAGSVFQVYAPYAIKLHELKRKIIADCTGARNHWKLLMDTWVFVHNDPDGLPADALQLLFKLEQKHQPLSIGRWGQEELWDVTVGISLEKLIALFGEPPTREHLPRLGFEKIRPILEHLRGSSCPDLDPIAPVSVDKLEFNQLSSAAAELLQAGRHREPVVEAYLARSVDPTLGEAVAARFRHEYRELVARGLAPNDIFRELHRFAGGGERGDPDHEVAVLAILSYFFERCDIFENPVAVSAA